MFKFYNKHKKLISVLLCVMIVFTVFAGSYIQSYAGLEQLAFTPEGAAIILSLLSAFGIVINPDMCPLAADIYNDLSAASQNDLTLAGAALGGLSMMSAMNQVVMGQVQIEPTTLQEIVQLFQKNFSMLNATGTGGIAFSSYDVSGILATSGVPAAYAGVFEPKLPPAEAYQYEGLRNLFNMAEYTSAHFITMVIDGKFQVLSFSEPFSVKLAPFDGSSPYQFVSPQVQWYTFSKSHSNKVNFRGLGYLAEYFKSAADCSFYVYGSNIPIDVYDANGFKVGTVGSSTHHFTRDATLDPITAPLIANAAGSICVNIPIPKTMVDDAAPDTSINVSVEDVAKGIGSVQDVLTGDVTLDIGNDTVISKPGELVRAPDIVGDVDIPINPPIDPPINPPVDPPFSIPILGDILNALKAILAFLTGLLSQFFELLKELLISLFTVSDTYFQTHFDNLRGKFQGFALPQKVIDDLQRMGQTTPFVFGDIKINWFGQDCVIISAAYINGYLPTIRNWVRGVIFILLLFYNYSQVYKLIRGSSYGFAHGVATGQMADYGAKKGKGD